MKIEVHYGRCQSTERSPTTKPVLVPIFWTIDEDYPVVPNPAIPKQNPNVVMIKAFVQRGA